MESQKILTIMLQGNLKCSKITVIDIRISNRALSERLVRNFIFSILNGLKT